MMRRPAHERLRGAVGRGGGWRGLALALAVALCAAPRAAPAEGPRAAEILHDHAGAIGLLSRPATPAGHPQRHAAVLLVHDAFGQDRRSEAYTTQLLGAEMMVLEIELEALSADGADAPGAEPGRLPRALAALMREPDVDPARIGALGFGTGARALLLETGPPATAAMVLLYPGCGRLVEELAAGDAAARPPRGAALLLHGTADPANTVDDCARLAGLLAPASTDVQVTAWLGASYGWDIPQCASVRSWHPAPGGGPLAPVHAWPELTALSAARAAAFLDAHLAGGRR